MDPRTAYDEAASPAQLAHDGRLAGRRLHLLEQAARRAVLPAPPLTYEAAGVERAKPTLEIDAAAAHLARLYLD